MRIYKKRKGKCVTDFDQAKFQIDLFRKAKKGTRSASTSKILTAPPFSFPPSPTHLQPCNSAVSICWSHDTDANLERGNGRAVLKTCGRVNRLPVVVRARKSSSSSSSSELTGTEPCSPAAPPTPSEWGLICLRPLFSSDFRINGVPAKQMRHLPSAQEDRDEEKEGMGG